MAPNNKRPATTQNSNSNSKQPRPNVTAATTTTTSSSKRPAAASKKKVHSKPINTNVHSDSSDDENGFSFRSAEDSSHYQQLHSSDMSNSDDSSSSDDSDSEASSSSKKQKITDAKSAAAVAKAAQAAKAAAATAAKATTTTTATTAAATTAVTAKKPIVAVAPMFSTDYNDEDNEANFELSSDDDSDSESDTTEATAAATTASTATAAITAARSKPAAASNIPAPFNTTNSEVRVPSNISAAAQAVINNSSSSSSSSNSSLTAPSTASPHNKLIIVLLKSSLETIKSKKGYELVSADTHRKVLSKMSKTPNDYRPDITHQCLLTLLDSPLNKAGKLQVYIQTERNVLIHVNNKIRIPRTYKRFAGLMVQLLHKLKIRSSDGPDVLLKVIKNPVTAHLPAGCLKIGTSTTGELVDIRALAAALPRDREIVITVGAHASGPASADWTEKQIAVSQYPLSAAYAISRICNAFEYQWGCL